MSSAEDKCSCIERLIPVDQNCEREKWQEKEALWKSKFKRCINSTEEGSFAFCRSEEKRVAHFASECIGCYDETLSTPSNITSAKKLSSVNVVQKVRERSKRDNDLKSKSLETGKQKIRKEGKSNKNVRKSQSHITKKKMKIAKNSRKGNKGRKKRKSRKGNKQRKRNKGEKTRKGKKSLKSKGKTLKKRNNPKQEENQCTAEKIILKIKKYRIHNNQLRQIRRTLVKSKKAGNKANKSVTAFKLVSTAMGNVTNEGTSCPGKPAETKQAFTSYQILNNCKFTAIQICTDAVLNIGQKSLFEACESEYLDFIKSFEVNMSHAFID